MAIFGNVFWSRVLNTRAQMNSCITSEVFYALCTTRFRKNDLGAEQMHLLTLNFGYTFLKHHCSEKINSNTSEKLVQCYALCTTRLLVTAQRAFIRSFEWTKLLETCFYTYYEVRLGVPERQVEQSSTIEKKNGKQRS